MRTLAAAVDSGRTYGVPGLPVVVLIVLLLVGVGVLLATRPGR